jgi:iron complex outermembrane receptor protein
MNQVLRNFYRITAGVTLTGCALPALAQEQPRSNEALQEIVVVAQKRAENLQKVPLSVSAFDAGALEARGIDNILDLATSMPGLQLTDAAGVVLPFLRGVGSSATTVGSEASVAVYVDGVYYSRLRSGFFDLANLERVEVLKGPQGTLFGRNSSGGVIHLITSDPSHDTQVKGSLSYGRFDSVLGSVYATTGLSDTVSADISISGRTSGGYGRNVTVDKRHGYEDSFLARSKLLFEPSDTTRILVSGFYSWSDMSAQGGTFPGTQQGALQSPTTLFRQSDIGYYNVRDSEGGHNESKTWSFSLKAEQELSFARLVSISAYMRGTEFNLVDGIYDPTPDFRVELNTTVKQFTQELQLQSLPAEKLSWILGLYYYNNLSRYDGDTIFRGFLFGPGISAPSKQHAISYAVFGQATYEILPRLRFTGGLRFTRDKADADGMLNLLTTPTIVAADPPAAKDSIKKVTFKGAMDYQATDNILTYASVSRSFKSGQFNLLTYDPRPTDAEMLDAYEVGIKSELFDRRLRLNVSAFYYDIKNPQVLLVANGTVLLSNAQASRVKGFELEGQALLAPGLISRFAATYLDSKYKRYGVVDPITGNCVARCAPSGPPNPDPAIGGTVVPLLSIDAAGNRTPYASKLTFNVGLDYKLETSHGDWAFTIDYYYNDGFYFEPDNFLRQKNYEVVSGQIKYMPTENVAIRVWGKNLNGQKYASWASTQEGVAGYPWTPAPPRTYGIAVDFTF